MKKGIVVTAIIAVIVLSSPLSAQQIEYVGSTLWTGATQGEYYNTDSHSYILCVQNEGISIYDTIGISNTPNPVSRIPLESGASTKICVYGNYLFVATSIYDGINYINGAIKIYDISDINYPILKSSLNSAKGFIGISVSGNIATSVLANEYIDHPPNPPIYHPPNLLKIDISNILSPQIIGSCEILINPAKIQLKGDTAFVGGSHYFQIYDMQSNIPNFIGGYTFSLEIFNFNIYQNRAFFATTGQQVSILNISNPQNPEFYGGFTINNRALDVICNGVYIYVAAYSNGCEIYKEIDSTFYQIVHNFIPRGNAISLNYYNNQLLIIDQYYGLECWGIANPYFPTFHYELLTPTLIWDVANYGNILCASDQNSNSNTYGGLRLLDISNPEQPRELVGLTGIKGLKKVYCLNDYIFTGDYYHGYLRIIDTSIPNLPIVLDSIYLENGIEDIHGEGNQVYVAMRNPFGNANVFGIDISNPSDIEATWQYINYYSPRGVFGKDSLVYIVYSSDSLIILHTVYSGIPPVIGRCGVTGNPQSIYVSGYYAYITTRNAGLKIVDVSNPNLPNPISQVSLGGRAYGITVHDTLAFVARGYPNGALKVVNTSDPYNPRITSSFSFYDNAENVTYSNDHIYVARHSSVAIFRMTSTGIEEVGTIPSSFSLSPNYPNPFNSSTTIRYNLPTESPVTIDIYDILGRKVQTLLDIKAQAGPHQVNWQADGLPSGAYFARLKTGEQSQTMKMILMK